MTEPAPLVSVDDYLALAQVEHERVTEPAALRAEVVQLQWRVTLLDRIEAANGRFAPAPLALTHVIPTMGRRRWVRLCRVCRQPGHDIRRCPSSLST